MFPLYPLFISGVCNYANMVNGTIVPKCECTDPSDTSAGCSDSLIPDGQYIEDGSGLFNNLEENFFDPLIAVFVDHPDLWTSASWAWAAGLMSVCLVLFLCICSSCLPGRKGGEKFRWFDPLDSYKSYFCTQVVYSTLQCSRWDFFCSWRFIISTFDDAVCWRDGLLLRQY